MLGNFSGRLGELAELDQLLDQAPAEAGRVIAIGGTAGIGKTALAVFWAHRVAHRFPGGQLYANLRGFDANGAAAEPAEVLRRFLDALNIPPQRVPADLDAQAALYRSHLAGRRILLVLDNARDSAQVRPLLPGAPGCLVLVTSRRQLTSLIATDSAYPLTLHLPTDADARLLLSSQLRAPGSSLCLSREAGDRRRQASALNAVGWYQALLGDHEPALDVCGQALVLHKEFGDRHGKPTPGTALATRTTPWTTPMPPTASGSRP